MNQKLLLREKDYELLTHKRILTPKHSFNDPLINPPKEKLKKPRTSNIKSIPKTNNLLVNNVLERRPTKPVKALTPVEPKMMMEEEAEFRNESTPWKTILNYFIKAYDYRKEPVDLQVANVVVKIYSLSEVRESRLTTSIEEDSPSHNLKSTANRQ